MAASLLTAGVPAPAQADPEPTQPASPTITTFLRPDDPDAPLYAAIDEAKKQNKPVAVEAAFTEQSRTWAYPDGHLDTEAYAGAIQLKQMDGSWARIDPALVETNGVVKPKLTKADVTFSAGGDQPFATLEHKDKKSLAMSWPSPLPKPQLDGAKATYVGAAGPSADLVVTATLSGFRHDVVLRERPTEPVEYRILITTKGATLGKTKAGGLKLTDDQGKTVATGGEPFMVETATADPKGTDEATGTIDTKIVTEAGGQQVLVLKPDPAFLADPKTTYPVTVDPTVGLTVSQDAVYDDGTWATGTFHLNAVGTQAKPRSIYECTGLVCTTRYVYYALHNRSIIQFGGFSFPGKAITSAQMQLYGQYLGRCDNWQLTASPATSSWSASTVSWYNRPPTTSVGASSIIPSCSTTSSWHTWDLTSAARSWAGGTPNNGLELVTTELNWEYTIDDPRFPDHQFWRFDSADAATSTVPKMSVSYLLPPQIPTVTAESIDSMDGNDAISRSSTVKTGFTSSSPDGRNLDYTVTVTDATTLVDAPATPSGGSTSSADARPAQTTAAVPGLVAAYGMDAGTGTALADDSGTNHTGTASSTTWVDGKYGKALSFDGNASKVTIPHAADLALPSGHTMSAWVKPSTLSGYRSIAFKNHTSGVTYGLYASNGTVPSSWMRTGGAHGQVNGTTALPANAWSHVAVTHDGSTARLYVNGSLISSAPIGTLEDSGGGLQIGSNAYWGEYFAGVIDELRLYNRPQTNAEIQADMATPVSGPVKDDPPTAPGDPTATAGEGSISLTWPAATDDRAIGGYDVHRSKTADFTPSASTLRTSTAADRRSFTDTNLPGTGTYNYKVVAKDSAGQAGPASKQASAYLKTLAFGDVNVPSGQAINKSIELGSPETMRFKVKACVTGWPTVCNESPYYRITTDAPTLPTDTETSLEHPTQPILSGMVNRPSGGAVTAKYYLYDSNGTPIGAVPLGTRTVNGGTRGSYQIPVNIVQPGTTYKWQMVACAQGPTTADEICTSKTAPVSFTTPGIAPPPPAEDVRHVTLGKDNIVIKTAKTDPTACSGAPCTVTDDTVIRIGGTGTNKTAAVIGFKLDELPDGAGVSEGILKLGTPTCPAGACPADTVVTATPLESPVTSESKGSDLAGDADPTATPHSLPLSAPQANIVGSEYQWLLLTSDKDELVTFGEAAAAEQPSLALTYLPAGAPSKVLNLTATGGDRSATASWGLPESNGGLVMLSGYDVEVVDNSGTVAKALEVNDPYAAISGLDNNVTYSIRVRAKTGFGQGEWESTTFTTRPVSPPPTSGNGSCVLESAPAIASAASASSGMQAYIDRVKHYYEAQDAVLEGRAASIWDAPGVTPDASDTAKLSLLNAALVEARDSMIAGGLTRTDSVVELSGSVVQATSDGGVRVTTGVKRSWKQPDGSAQNSSAAKAPSVSGTSGQIEPSAFTVTVVVFDRCGDVTMIDVPINLNLDTTDFYDPQVICGHQPSAGAVESAKTTTAATPGGQYCVEEGWPTGKPPAECANWQRGFTGEHACVHGWVSKFWQVKVEMGSDWLRGSDEATREYGAGGYPFKWVAHAHLSYMRLFPTQGEKWDSPWGKKLLAGTRMSVVDETCFGLSETQTKTTAGLTVGGSLETGKIGGTIARSISTETTETDREDCKKFEYKPAAMKTNPRIAWERGSLEGRCTTLDPAKCVVKRYHRSFTGRLVFNVKNAQPQRDNQDFIMGCDFLRSQGYSGTRVYVSCVDACEGRATSIPFPGVS
ncbi:LamG-like jellyroll fold domain-containing protein [[Actinomadura] parvosata]|uniref:LamG-like jellyroll fold domain-containing protein n=1 Tax=[Actinomadura] parvosata TaxID=1955412 RepID=UPI00406BE9CB